MRIICADHSRLGLAKLKRIIQQIVPNAKIETFRKPDEVLSLAGGQEINVLLTEIDFGRSRFEGMELARKVKKKQPHVNIIFVTAEPANELGEDILEIRPSGYVTKPYEEEDIRKEFENLRYPDNGETHPIKKGVHHGRTK